MRWMAIYIVPNGDEWDFFEVEYEKSVQAPGRRVVFRSPRAGAEQLRGRNAAEVKSRLAWYLQSPAMLPPP